MVTCQICNKPIKGLEHIDVTEEKDKYLKLYHGLCFIRVTELEELLSNQERDEDVQM